VPKVPTPRLEGSPSFEIRLTGSAPVTENGQAMMVFTYEAIPLKSGDLSLPKGVIELPDRVLDIPATPVKIQELSGHRRNAAGGEILRGSSLCR